MFEKLKSVAGEAKEKLAGNADAMVREFLGELQTLQPFLAKANIRLGGFRLTISIPPSFEILSDPGMDWNAEFNEKAFEGLVLSKYQEMVVNGLRQVFQYSKEINAKGFQIGKVDFQIGIPPKITIEVKPKDVALEIG